MSVLRYRGEFRPIGTFSPRTHRVLVVGKPRTDYLIERDDEGQKIVIENMTYEELCHFQIEPMPVPKRKST